jgi:peptidyl-prolyl cis-trans isomerase B (cyclophilin B)
MSLRRRAVATCVTAAVVIALVAACGGSKPSKAATPKTPIVAGCTPVAGSGHKPETFDAEPPLTVAKTNYTATLVTNCGTIVVAMDAAKTPHTVNSFAFLAGKHWFDNTPCHRLTTQGIHVVQCGDPTGTGAGDPGYTLPDENLGEGTYTRGTLALANADAPNTGGSQFFIVYGDTALPPQYTPFGHVTSGLDIIDKVAAAGEDDADGPGDGHPNQPLVITNFTVTR